MARLSKKTDGNDLSDVQNLFKLALVCLCWNKFKMNEIISNIPVSI